VHLGNAKDITPEELESLETVDVLILPVSDDYIDAKTAESLTKKIEPRIVVPVGNQSASFLELMGVSKEVPPQPKAKIEKSSLPIDKTEVINLLQ